MSYLALARKYRPRRFEDVIGQPHVVKALAHALAGDKLHPAILLTGTRGVGKTTLARIIAKGLNCETGVSANPCGQCSACREVDEGRFVDLLEIDAASRTKVDDTRAMLDNVQYSPVRGRYKVYLIDEVHMLSGHSFNALLKTLEEPPPHVKFILATTDPQKLPITVLSRCLQFNLKRMPVALIRERLTKVLQAEGVEPEPGAVAEIARAADGSMRDGLSLLDQALAFCGGAPNRAAVEEMLGTIGRQTLFDILGALAQGDAGGVLAAIEKLDGQAPDYSALLSDLAAHLQRVAVLQVLPQARSDEDEAALVDLARKLPAEDVQLYYQIAVLGRRDLPWTPDPRLGFEMALLRMLAFRPETGGGSSPAAPGGRPQAAAAGSQAAASGAVPGAPASSWAQRIESLGLEGFNKQLARHCVVQDEQGGVLRLALDAKMKHLLQEERRAALEQALARQSGQPLRVVIELVAGAVGTPAQQEAQQAVDRQRAAEAAIESDPAVRALKEKFGATIRPGSVQPIEK
ncbi:MAG: DNA polymerase III subunit gamma/tau [Gammaproteobacteria bacterium]|nr:DNA polymerase III subunit gamma/tau [Gammaproteobacteria bacterium]